MPHARQASSLMQARLCAPLAVQVTNTQHRAQLAIVAHAVRALTPVVATMIAYGRRVRRARRAAHVMVPALWQHARRASFLMQAPLCALIVLWASTKELQRWVAVTVISALLASTLSLVQAQLRCCVRTVLQVSIKTERDR